MPRLLLESSGVELASVAHEPVHPSAKAMYTRPSLSICRSLKSSRFLLEPPMSRQSPLLRHMLPICTGSEVARTVWKVGFGSSAFRLYVT